MRVFITGASGFIGSAIVQEFIHAGNQVLGLARSDASAKWLKDAGAEVHRGNLEDLESLKSGAANSDGVIHLGFNHDFSKFVANCEADRKTIEALGAALAGSSRRLIITSGTGHNPSGKIRTEDDALVPSTVNPRGASEEAGEAVSATGVDVLVMRLPQVHDPFKQGLITPLIALAREKGISAYVGNGSNRWPAVHRTDAAHLYKLVFERGVAGARYNAVAEEEIPIRDIAESIGRGLNIPAVSLSPEEAVRHFGWLSFFVAVDMPASGALTQERLGWLPTGPGLISDLDQAKF